MQSSSNFQTDIDFSLCSRNNKFVCGINKNNNKVYADQADVFNNGLSVSTPHTNNRWLGVKAAEGLTYQKKKISSTHFFLRLLIS